MKRTLNIITWTAACLACFLAGYLMGVTAPNRNAVEASEPVHRSAVQLLRQQHRNQLTSFQKTIMAMAWTESRCRTDAVGADGDWGILQMLDIYVQEANRVSGGDWSHWDAFNARRSLDILFAMQDHYNAERSSVKAIRLHNKSEQYRREVESNRDWIERYEDFRNLLIEYK